MNFVPGSPQSIPNPSTPAGLKLKSPDLRQQYIRGPSVHQHHHHQSSSGYPAPFDPQFDSLPQHLNQSVRYLAFDSVLHQVPYPSHRTPTFEYHNSRAVNNNSALSYNSEASPATLNTSSSSYSLHQPFSAQESEESKYSIIMEGNGKRSSHSNERNFFPNHNPFDFNSYPITNPPLIDATYIAYAADGHPRRRRISISNGQIGQIVNHEAIFDSDFSLDDAYTQQGMNNDDNIDVPFQTGYVDDSVLMGVDNVKMHPQQQQQQQQQQHVPMQDQHSHQRAGPAFNQNMFKPQQPQQGGPVSMAPGTLPPNQQQQMHKASVGMGGLVDVPGMAMANAGSKVRGSTSVPVNQNTGLPDSLADAAGVPPPNHQLIYNNEVIYNPNDGPIPGTAAWKKERLLERNRIAASKCRQRKKQAQQELVANVSKYEKKADEMKEKMTAYAHLVHVYNERLGLYFKLGDPAVLESLRSYVGVDVEDAVSMLERKTRGVTIKDDPDQQQQQQQQQQQHHHHHHNF